MSVLVSPLHQPYDPERGEALRATERGYVLPASEKTRLDHVEVRPSGEQVQHYVVEDPYFAQLRRDNPYAYGYAVEERDQLRTAFDAAEAALRSDPSDAMTAQAQELIFNGSATMQAWRELFPTAKALYPLQRPDSPSLPRRAPTADVPVPPQGVHIDNMGYERFAYSLDAIGIRTRAVLARQVFVDHARDSGKKRLEWVSLGAGAAIPVFEGLQEIRQTLPRKRVHAYAVDMSADALEFAKEKSADYGVKKREFTTLERNLVRDVILSDKLANEIGKKVDMVDLLGVFEYFPEEKGRAADLLRKSFELVADDGILVFGNMLDTHPQLQINQRAVGWPDIKPRSIEQITSIITAAGISMDAVTIMVPDDGVYAVVRIEKRANLQAKVEAEPDTGNVIQIGRAASFFAQRDPADLSQAA